MLKVVFEREGRGRYREMKSGERREWGEEKVGRGERKKGRREEGGGQSQSTGAIAKSSSFPASGGSLYALNQLGASASAGDVGTFKLKKAFQNSPTGGHAPHETVV